MKEVKGKGKEGAASFIEHEDRKGKENEGGMQGREVKERNKGEEEPRVGKSGKNKKRRGRNRRRRGGEREENIKTTERRG